MGSILAQQLLNKEMKQVTHCYGEFENDSSLVEREKTIVLAGPSSLDMGCNLNVMGAKPSHFH
jgi:hypothetical protein